MSTWAYRIHGHAENGSDALFKVSRSFGELLYEVRVGRHHRPGHRLEILVPSAARPDELRALRVRGCLLRYPK